MIFYRLGIKFVYLLLFMVLLAACGQEQVVYVPVTVTPAGSGAQGAAADEDSEGAGALPPALSVE
ncbi:MAG: hypothetical protein ACPGWR_33880, partial [Ardenticatenaceae bacterium]